jgi:proliferating cell nuclear antigen
MNLTLNVKHKIDVLVAIFQLLKNCSSVVKLEFNDDNLFIQGMDKSHVCLFNININSKWFTTYETTETINVVIDSTSIHTILSRSQENNTLVLMFENSQEHVDIHLLISADNGKSDNGKSDNGKNEFNRYFQIPILDLEQDSLIVPEVDYDAEFSLKTKQLCELTSQLILFGEILEISCSEDGIHLNTSGEHGKMTVNIPIDDLNEFTISEGEKLELSYSLNYIHKMCLTTKLSKDIEISISNDYPIRLKYDLGDESYVVFFVAPKM